MSIASVGKTPFAGPVDIRFVGSLEGRYAISSRPSLSGSAPSVFACRSLSVSPTSVMIEGPVIGAVGEEVTALLEHLGAVKGEISRRARGVFQIAVVADPATQSLLAAKINWLKLKHVGRAANRRQDRRFKPRNSKSFLYVDDVETDCFVIDISSSGAAASAAIKPRVGATVQLGSVPGRVVRHLEAGFAIQFSLPQEIGTLEASLTQRLQGQKDSGQPPSR